MYSEFCGEFIEFYNHENNEYAIFKLGENIFGRYCINNPNLKIKLYQTETSGEKENFIIKYITDNTLVFYILLIGLALAFILVAWFYYEWIF
jgi:RNA recognition motif-containing protein